MRGKNSIKYFPFSSGLPWQVRNGKYVKPEISGSILRNALEDKTIIVSAFGGLLESFFSLSILEVANHILPGNKLFWSGHPEYYNLIKENGLAKIFTNINQDILNRFPVPVFFDKESRAYFNCLNNYLNVSSYYLTPGYEDLRPAIKQIVEKSTVPWNINFIPKLRHSGLAPKPSIIKDKVPYVLVFPDRTGLSKHNVSCLNWDARKVRSFATMISPEFRLLIVTNNRELYFNINADITSCTVDNVISLLPHAYAVLSKDIDILLVALAITNAKLLSLPVDGPFKLHKNANFLMKNNDIYIIESLSPEAVWRGITKLGVT
ncbi:MAG: hypothetical protein Q8P20_09745 [bacterium]|nr:hypothetical protein [bacterium]